MDIRFSITGLRFLGSNTIATDFLGFNVREWLEAKSDNLFKSLLSFSIADR